MSNLRGRRLTTIDLDRVLGGATATSGAAVGQVRAGAMPSEVKAMLMRHTGVTDPSENELDVAPRAPATTAPSSTAPSAREAPERPAAAERPDASGTETSAGTDSDASTSSGVSSGNARVSPSSASDSEEETTAPRPASASTGTSSVPLPPPRPDFEGQRALSEFTARDPDNRAHGYYGAFGDAPTGPSAQSLNDFTTQDNANRAAGYHGAFGEEPNGPSAQSLNDFTVQDDANRAAGYHGAFGDAPTGPSAVDQSIQSQVGVPEVPAPVQFDAPINDPGANQSPTAYAEVAPQAPVEQAAVERAPVEQPTQDADTTQTQPFEEAGQSEFA